MKHEPPDVAGPTILKSDEAAGIASVLMLPDHFRAYQLWLHSRGQRLHQLTSTTDLYDTYAPTVIDVHGTDPDKD